MCFISFGGVGARDSSSSRGSRVFPQSPTNENHSQRIKASEHEHRNPHAESIYVHVSTLISLPRESLRRSAEKGIPVVFGLLDTLQDVLPSLM